VRGDPSNGVRRYQWRVFEKQERFTLVGAID
jgi:hypothetical protein